MRRTFVVVGSSLVLLLIACSGDDSSSTPGPSSSSGGSSSGSSGDDGGSSGDASSSSSSGSSSGGTTNPTDCNATADALCSYLARCLPSVFGLGYADVATCTTRGALACNIDKQSPGAGVVPTACATDLKALARTGGTLIAPASCRVKGTLADDAVCENDVQCTSGSCVKDPGAASPCGKCTARAALDGSCINNVKCDWDLVCASTTCKAPVAKDAACVKGQCTGPYRCVGGICKDPVQLDGACNDNAPDDDWCDGTKLLYCKRTVPAAPAGTCKALAIAAVGQACGVVSNELVVCGAGASCEGLAGNRTCQMKAIDGASCDTNLGPTCADPAECINGKCTLPPADRCK
jgi:hypothetical protein